MRKFAVQVPEQVSRLLRSSLISTPPTWYQPALANPPPILPARRSRERPPFSWHGEPLTTGDLSRGPTRLSQLKKETQKQRYKPRVIKYEEDKIRTQFFRDYPFEALRATSLVEMRSIESEHAVKGSEWISLEQRGAYPTVEDLVEFVLNLRQMQGLSLSRAYKQATEEFVKLRARHEMATMAAEIEARHWGAEFPTEPFERFHNKLTENLDTNAPDLANKGKIRSVVKYKKPNRLFWSAQVPEEALPSDEYHAGKNYVHKWRLPAPPVMDTSSDSLLAAIDAKVGSPGLDGGKEKEKVEKEKLHEMDDTSFLHTILGGKKE
ncbi:mitochondrial ribosomal protein S25-domain-containing protein [Naematelia encephala]|uniref:Small ribosomal subunit protein mS23 n=1 Tax=Naematelia encephala TaxID=71784 RepID=A0A1Y2B961_9TREE|nr:mitochondrial ribosomal protein S25-domain-containing protein [Naematelia encephala]